MANLLLLRRHTYALVGAPFNLARLPPGYERLLARVWDIRDNLAPRKRLQAEESQHLLPAPAAPRHVLTLVPGSRRTLQNYFLTGLVAICAQAIRATPLPQHPT